MPKKQSLSQSMNRIGKLIHSTLDLREIMERVIAEAARAVGSETAAVSLRQGEHWVVSYVHGFPQDVIGAQMDDRQEPHAVLAIKTKKPVVIKDAFNDARVNCEHMKKWGVRSVLVVPLVTEDEVIGVLFFNQHKPGVPFQESHADFAGQLASSLSLAIRNARLFAQLQGELAQREKAERVQQETNEQLQLQSEELRVTNEELQSQAEELRAANEELQAQQEELQAQTEELRENAQALRESEERHRSLFENMLDGYAYCQMLFDGQGRPIDFVYLSVNDAFTRLTGLENVVGKKVTEVIPTIRVSHPELLETYGRVATTGRPERFEIEFEPLGIWLSISVYCPRPGYFTAVFDNITERKRAEEARARLAAIVESSEDAIISKNLDGIIQTWNAGAERLLGYRAEEIIGQPIALLLPRERRDEEDEILRRLRRGEYVEHFETVRVAKDGRRVDVSATISPLRAADGTLIGASKIVRDITERKRMEVALRESEVRLRLAQQAAKIGTFEWNVQTGVNVWTPELEAMYGLAPGEFGKTQPAWEQLVHPEDRAAAVGLAHQTFATGEPVQAEWRVTWRDGSVHWIAGRFQAFKDAAGRPLRLTGVNIDITERKQAEEQIARSQKTFSELVERAPFGMYIVDSQFRIALMNAGSQEGAFRNVRPVIGRDFAEAMRILWPEPVAAEIIAVFRHTLETGEPYYSPRFTNPRHDVETVESYEWELHRMTLPDGQYGVICYYYDSTTLREAEAAVRESEERFHTMANAIPQLAWIARADGYIDWYNQRWHDYTGTTPEEMEGWGWQSVHDPQELPKVLERWKSSLVTGRPFDMIFPLRGADGVFRPFLTRVMPLKDEQGQVRQWFGTNTDVSEQKRAEAALQEANEQLQAQAEELQIQAEELRTQTNELADVNAALRESEERFRHYFELGLIGMAITSPAKGMMEVNDECCRLLGYERDELLQKTWAELTYPDDLAADVAQFDRVLAGEIDGYRIDKRFIRKNGEVVAVTISVTGMRGADGAVDYFLALLQDITERKRAEESLRELNATLESKVAERTAQLQHRARQLQKLTLELSQVEDRERKRMAEILHDDLQQIIAGAKFHLTVLRNRVKHDASMQAIGSHIDEMLREAVEKSRTLSHELSPAVLHYGDLTEALGWLASQVQAKHGLVVHVRANSPANVESEAVGGFLYKAAQELLFNVVKHARVKEAELRVRRHGPYVCVSVSDRGRGFDPLGLRQTAGFGLLSIRERIELLGGRMKIKSAPGRGSTFLIVVPDREAAEAGGQTTKAGSKTEEGAPSSVLPSPSSVLRVLVADDHRIVREGLRSLLSEERDIEIVGEAVHGREAVDLALRLEPEVVIMDVAMPLIDGDEATQQIKTHLPKTRVIALSTYNEPEMMERMYRAGAEGYVLKTASAEELLAAIRGQSTAGS